MHITISVAFALIQSPVSYAQEAAGEAASTRHILQTRYGFTPGYDEATLTFSYEHTLFQNKASMQVVGVEAGIRDHWLGILTEYFMEPYFVADAGVSQLLHFRDSEWFLEAGMGVNYLGGHSERDAVNPYGLMGLRWMDGRGETLSLGLYLYEYDNRYVTPIRAGFGYTW